MKLDECKQNIAMECFWSPFKFSLFNARGTVQRTWCTTFNFIRNIPRLKKFFSALAVLHACGSRQAQFSDTYWNSAHKLESTLLPHTEQYFSMPESDFVIENVPPGSSLPFVKRES